MTSCDRRQVFPQAFRVNRLFRKPLKSWRFPGILLALLILRLFFAFCFHREYYMINKDILIRAATVSIIITLPAAYLLLNLLSGGGSGEAQQSAGLLYMMSFGVIFVSSVLSVVVSFMLQGGGAKAPKTRKQVSGRETGTVKRFYTNRGFGFITRDSGGEVFVHFRGIRGKGHRSLSPGQRVEYDVTQGEKGLQAVDVDIID